MVYIHISYLQIPFYIHEHMRDLPSQKAIFCGISLLGQLQDPIQYL